MIPFSIFSPSFSSQSFPLFHSVILESRGTIDSPILLPRYQSPFCAHRLKGWAFPCFSFFLQKPMADFSIPKCACFWCHIPYGSTFGRPSFLSFFLSGQNPTLLVRKFFCYYFLFYSSLFWFPEVPFLCIVRGYSRLSPFSCWISGTWEGHICPLFLVFFFLAFSFELS